MNCNHAPSGCNYPESECVGLCYRANFDQLGHFATPLETRRSKIINRTLDALALCLVLFMLCMATVAFVPEIERELSGPNATDARKQQQSDWRRDLGAAALCRHEHGAGTGFTFTVDGELVCLPRSKTF